MENEEILYNSFNQENDCFIIGKKDGFTIYHSDPLKKIMKICKYT